VPVASLTGQRTRRRPVAFFGFQLINTSLQSTTAEEKGRIRMLDDAFRKKLDASGRFKIVPIPSDVLQEVAAASAIATAASATSRSRPVLTGRLGAQFRK
jgi:Protein of unknown function (DUF2380)